MLAGYKLAWSNACLCEGAEMLVAKSPPPALALVGDPFTEALADAAPLTPGRWCLSPAAANAGDPVNEDRPLPPPPPRTCGSGCVREC
jgi:hypothetical protein